MRILTLILAVLCLLFAAGMGFVRAGVNLEDAAALEETAKLLGEKSALLEAAAAAGSEEAKLVSEATDRIGGIKMGGYALYVLAILSAVLLVMAFVKKAVIPLALATVVVAVATIVINPDYETGALAAASARKAAMIIGIPGALGALFALASEKLRQKKAAA